MVHIYKTLSVLVCIVLAASACGNGVHSNGVTVDPYYLTGSRENREQLENLFALLAGNNSPESTFAIVREIANNFTREEEFSKLIHFLGRRTINNPDDPYNSFYLLKMAYAYMQMDSLPVAKRYFDLIVRNYPDLTVSGESIHLASLNQLIELTGDWGERVWYYQELISRFPDDIDQGAAWFMLAQAYERVGHWTGAIQAYARYLPHAGPAIPGFPNAHAHARQQVDFHNSPKDWTFENLPALVDAVQYALDAGNPALLRRYQAKVNFFTRSWEQSETDTSRVAEINLANFMRGNRIRWAENVDSSSTANEAFLRTWGWPQHISTWYFYFRKINFPSDPEIHGRWEWAGIYYGEKF